MLMMSDLAIILYSILAIELTLDWSNISGVYNVESVGQLIPFIIGAVGLFRTIHSIFIDKFTPESPAPKHLDANVVRSRSRRLPRSRSRTPLRGLAAFGPRSRPRSRSRSPLRGLAALGSR